jgi:hypothetical protein
MTPNNKDDFYELPTVPVRPTALVKTPTAALTKVQKNSMTEAERLAASVALEAVKTALDIWKIREISTATVAEIHAETDRLRVQLHGDLEKMREDRASLRERGAIVVELLRAGAPIVALLAEADRVRFIEQLPGIIEATLKDQR